MKLLKEEKIQQAELFVLDPDGFKKVIIEPLPADVSTNSDYRWAYFTEMVVYLHRGKKSTRLRTGQACTKDAWPRVTIGGDFVPWKNIYGVVVKEELLKPSELNKYYGSPQE